MKSRKAFFGSIDMTAGKPLGLMVRFTIPLLIGNLFQQLYNIIDSVIVGNWEGPRALAAVGVCFPVLMIFFSIFFGIGSAASVMVAQYKGAKSPKQIKRTVQTANSLLFLGGIPLSMAGVLLSGPMLRLINVPADTLPGAVLYLQISFAGAISAMGFNIASGILRGIGNSALQLKYLAIACVVNIVLDIAFVVGFGWGVAGAAVATVLAQIVSWVLCQRAVMRVCFEDEPKGVRTAFFAVDKPLLKRMLKLGIPMSVQHGVFMLGTLTMSSLVNSYGSGFVAGFNAASKIDAFVFLPIQSFAVALTTFVAQNMGAGAPARIRQGLRKGLLAVLVMCVALVGVTLPLGPALMHIFTSNANVIASGMAYIWRIMPFYPLFAVCHLLEGTMRGTGNAVMPTVTTLMALWLGRVPAAYLLAAFAGRDDMFFCYGIGWVVELIPLGIYFFSNRWKRCLRVRPAPLGREMPQKSEEESP